MQNNSDNVRTHSIGLLGGSFNPLHIGHLRLCLEMIEQAGLDKVYLVPSSIPPHKDIENILPFEHRCAMIESSIAGMKALEINRLEQNRPGPSYTYDTLRIFSADNPGVRTCFIMGDNDLLSMAKWHKGREIPGLCDLLVAGRKTEGHRELDSFILDFWVARREAEGIWRTGSNRRIRYFSAPRIDISSSMVREKWLSGRNIDWLAPAEVVRFLDYNHSMVARTWGRCE